MVREQQPEFVRSHKYKHVNKRGNQSYSCRIINVQAYNF